MTAQHKCPHGVYDASGTGVAEYCTICTQAKPLSEEDLKVVRAYRHRHDPYPHGERRCPKCGGSDFTYQDDVVFCGGCGFDGS